MNIVHIGEPIDRIEAESKLRDDILGSIGEYAGILTIAQVLGILQIVAVELMEEHQ